MAVMSSFQRAIGQSEWRAELLLHRLLLHRRSLPFRRWLFWSHQMIQLKCMGAEPPAETVELPPA
eukprot:1653310-Amphidinium_carterae.1